MARRWNRLAAAPDGRAREAGQVIVIFVLALTALLAAAGLAIDLGRFYTERRFLQNAADAAALAAGNVLVRGGSESEARAEANAILTRNFAVPPNGVTPGLPPPAGSEVYRSGFAGVPTQLVDGILISSSTVRVAVRNTIAYTFGRAVGLDTNTIVAQARVRFEGQLLPIAVRRYVNMPGSGTGVAPCTDDVNSFMDLFATAATACLGTDTNGGSRMPPSAGLAFNPSNPDDDRTNHGPIMEILGQGSDPDNGSDFRGFIALDIRNFQSATSQIYYNGISGSSNANTLKDVEAQWILDGGYPGPMFPPAVVPPDVTHQVAIMTGNSTGIAVAGMAERFAPGDEILVSVYPGVTMQIPDFSMSTPGTVGVAATGETDNASSFRVSRSQAFSGQVTLSTVIDPGDAEHPLTLGTMLNPASPISYGPNPVTPSLGSGTSVTMNDIQMSGAADGIHTLWLKGQAGSPYLTTKYTPFALRVGNISRDFSLSSDASEAIAANPGDTVTFTLNVKRSGLSSFGGSNVQLSLEAMPEGTLPEGLGSVSFSPSVVSPSGGNGTNATLSIGTGGMAPGTHQFAVRATGTNGDGQPVTRMMVLTVSVGTVSSSGRKEYIDIVGFAVMRVASISANTVRAYAITPVIADPRDSRLRRGQVVRLAPWN